MFLRLLAEGAYIKLGRVEKGNCFGNKTHWIL